MYIYMYTYICILNIEKYIQVFNNIWIVCIHIQVFINIIKRINYVTFSFVDPSSWEGMFRLNLSSSSINIVSGTHPSICMRVYCLWYFMYLNERLCNILNFQICLDLEEPNCKRLCAELILILCITVFILNIHLYYCINNHVKMYYVVHIWYYVFEYIQSDFNFIYIQLILNFRANMIH